MIRSMTAYARREIKRSWGSAIWEIRSVNQRFLEIYLHLPEAFSNLNPILRERMRSNLTRGKIECSLCIELNNSTQKKDLILNKKLAKQLVRAAKWIKIWSKEGKINLIDILRWPGVIGVNNQKFDIISTEVLVIFDNVLADFIAEREREGKVLNNMLKQRLKNIIEEVSKIRTYMPEILQWQHKRLVDKLTDSKCRIENHRIDQELIMIAQRSDVAEELDRLEAHIKEIFNILKKQEAVGRRLDFIIQECNRESNTLASKSINISISKSAIEMKVLIEQMREQIQNIE